MDKKLKAKKAFEAKMQAEREAERLAKNRKSYDELVKAMSELGYKKEEIEQFVLMLVRLASGSDYEADEGEYKLLMEITGLRLSEGEFYGLVKHAVDEAFISGVDQIVDSLSAEGKAAALDLFELFLRADDELTPEEARIYRILKA